MIRAEYLDHMGDDLRCVNAARVSMDKHHKTFEANDAGLIVYLSKHDHFTPSTHCVITLRETVPIFVARQRFKHTVGFTYNEVSRRYVDAPPEFFAPETWRKRVDDKKQGSSAAAVKYNDNLTAGYSEYILRCLGAYQVLLAADVCPEQARMVLPQSMMTSYYVTGSLYAFARAYNLRSQPDAQAEIRELAEQWDAVIRPLFPVSWSALTEARR